MAAPTNLSDLAVVYSCTMQVRVLFFGQLKDIFQRDSQIFDLADGATVSDLVGKCRQVASLHQQRSSFGGDIWKSLAVAVNHEYSSLAVSLKDGDEVALLPPVSGGLDEPVRLTREVIATDAIVAALKQGEDGALVVFDGIVRNNTRGRRTLYLDYEAYEAMAMTGMQRLVAEAKQQFPVRAVALVHRLGKLEIGETSVLIVVASAHRGAAFEACRWIIDTLKKTVPIWKKEYFEDGAVWADGEPFPEALRAGEPA
jgi:molybdopterin synthase catalytic subunit/molybdopterin converting factor small subunit